MSEQYKRFIVLYEPPKITISSDVVFLHGQPITVATAYDPISHTINIDDTTARCIEHALEDRISRPRLYASMLQLTAHVAVISLAYNWYEVRPKASTGYFRLHHGVSVVDGTIVRGRIHAQTCRYGLLNEAIASHLVITAVRHHYPEQLSGVIRAYDEWGLTKCVMIGKKLACLTSSTVNGTLELAFFCGNERALINSLAIHIGRASMVYGPLSRRFNVDDSLTEALRVLGAFIPGEPTVA